MSDSKVLAYLFFAKVIRKIGNHDLVLGGNAIFGWSALSWLARSTRFGVSSILGWLLCSSTIVGGFGQGKDLARDVGSTISSGTVSLSLR